MLPKIFNEQNIPPTQPLPSRHSATFYHNSASEEAQTPPKSDGVLIGKFFTFYPIFPSHAPPRKHERAQAIPYPYISIYETHRESDRYINRRILSGAIVCPRESNIGSAYEPILVSARTNIDCCRESYPLFILLRHRAPSSPIYPSEVISSQSLALSQVLLLSSGGKSILLMKKKAPSRSGFPLSMHVVLKTRHINPNIHVRRY